MTRLNSPASIKATNKTGTNFVKPNKCFLIRYYFVMYLLLLLLSNLPLCNELKEYLSKTYYLLLRVLILHHVGLQPSSKSLKIQIRFVKLLIVIILGSLWAPGRNLQWAPPRSVVHHFIIKNLTLTINCEMSTFLFQKCALVLI